MAAGPVTLLFTDLVGSTALLERVGDEQAQRVLRAHHQLLRDAVTVHGGCAVKWLGDGLMTTFGSSADAVRCAVAMQQTTRARAAGERLAMRVGLHVGEALRDERDWMGTPVTVARRLCDQAAAGQILCSALVVELLGGRRAFRFGEIGALALKGFAAPVAAFEVQYDRDDPAAALRHPPFLGRAPELARLEQRLEEARAGRGGMVMVAGEAGIGKTRMLDEFAEMARAQVTLVLRGRCYEGEAARPYGPFVEVIAQAVQTAPADTRRAELGLGAPALAQLVTAIRIHVTDIPEAAPLVPEEARVRLLDAAVQYLLAVANRQPTIIILDDLHWADPGTVTLLRHLARFAARSRLLVLGAYRDVEVDARHPLIDALGSLPRETNYDRLGLDGLDATAVGDLLEILTEHGLAQAFADDLARETAGNPFFIRAVLLHLLEERALVREEERWRLARPLAELRLPDTVLHVIERRLARLSEPARRLLGSAAAFAGGIDFAITHRVAGLDETTALDALDEVLAAQLLVPEAAQTYVFTHALVRQALYEALSPPRRARLHRDIADTMLATLGERATAHAAEIARHFHRSASLPGRERGVPFCLKAADQAQEAAAFPEVVTHLRAALALMPEGAAEQPQLLGRLGLALVWALREEEAQQTACEAMRRIAQTGDHQAAATYAVTVVTAMQEAGFMRGSWNIASEGLSYTAAERDLVWAILMSFENLRREASDPNNPGIVLDSSETREVARVFDKLGLLNFAASRATSRDDLVARNTVSRHDLTFLGAGDARQGVARLRTSAGKALRQGRLAKAVASYAMLAHCHFALGNLPEAADAYDRGVALADRLRGPSLQGMQLRGVAHVRRYVIDTGWEEALEDIEKSERVGPEFYFVFAEFRAMAALVHARMGRADEAMGLLAQTMPAIERAPGWAPTYPAVIHHAIEVSWLLERRDQVQALERNHQQKMLGPDFRMPLSDARLAMGRLCALEGRHGEASEWFTRARDVLEEEGQRPLRAIVDYDEALMYSRRDTPGDRQRALPLLDAALAQFRTLGMPGWIRRAETLQRRCQTESLGRTAADPAADPVSPAVTSVPSATTSPTGDCLFQLEGEYWTIAFEGKVVRLKDAAGLRYLAHLLRHTSVEFHALDLVAGLRQPSEPRRGSAEGAGASDAGPLLDAAAKAAYKRRLAELRAEVDDAERANDPGREARAREEIDVLTRELAAAVGLGGRDRRAVSDAERARLAVTQRVKAAIRRIAGLHPDLGRHLGTSVKTGTYCVYTPDPTHPVDWSR